MTLLQSVLLGVIQGITEFIPISSSGHLVLAPYFLGWELPPEEAFLFDVLVQVATLLAVFVYFRVDIREISLATYHGLRQREPFNDPLALLGWYLVIATIPAIAFGFILRESIERTFNNPVVTAFLLFGTALLLVLAEKVGKRDRTLDKVHWRDSIWIGLFQVLALYPGISRSGATIAGGMTRNLERTAAARFAFLMSIPVMIAAGVAASFELFQHGGNPSSLLPLLVGCVTAGVVGYFAIHWLLAFLSSRSLYVFAVYCTLVGALTLLLVMIRS